MPSHYLQSPLIAKSAEIAYFAQQLARQFRNNPTPAEAQLWRSISRKQIAGLKFLRQRPFFFDLDGVERYSIVDFYCHEKRLIIEVDGQVHEHRVEYDQLRTLIITNQGYTELRVSNIDVLTRHQEVIERIIKTTSRLPSIVGSSDIDLS